MHGCRGRGQRRSVALRHREAWIARRLRRDKRGRRHRKLRQCGGRSEHRRRRLLPEAFTDNCLVNVVALGLLRTDRILHSRVPPGGADYDLVLVGKATDGSGFGGAAFASLVLDAGEAQANKSAVQVPDPFLKNVIMRATAAVVDAVFDAGIAVGFKDLGAGGIMGSSSELCGAGGFGARIDIEAIPQAVRGLPPFVVACAETQERMLWAVPKNFTPTVLSIYNERFTLPDVASGARAAVIGHVTEDKRYVVHAMGETVIDVPIDVLTEPVRIERVRAAQGSASAGPTAKRNMPDSKLLTWQGF